MIRSVNLNIYTYESVSDKMYLKIVIHTFRVLDEAAEIGKSKAVGETEEKKQDVSGTKEGDR